MNIQLTKASKQAIKHIMSEPGWDEVVLLMDKVVDLWNKSPIKADTEFETLWRTAQREAKGEALKEFFNTLEEEVLK